MAGRVGILVLALALGCGSSKPATGAGNSEPPPRASLDAPSEEPELPHARARVLLGSYRLIAAPKGWIGGGGALPGKGQGTSSSQPARPTIGVGSSKSSGGLDKNVIRRQIRQQLRQLTSCYEKQLLIDPDLSGQVVANFTIAPTGKVRNVTAAGLHPKVDSCVARVIAAMQFPQPKGGGIVQVRYPFRFKSTAGQSSGPRVSPSGKPVTGTPATPRPPRIQRPTCELAEPPAELVASLPQLTTCYREQLAAAPGSGGIARVEVVGPQDGGAKRVTVTGVESPIESCIVKLLAELPAPSETLDDHEITGMIFVLAFDPGGAEQPPRQVITVTNDAIIAGDRPLMTGVDWAWSRHQEEAVQEIARVPPPLALRFDDRVPGSVAVELLRATDARLLRKDPDGQWRDVSRLGRAPPWPKSCSPVAVVSAHARPTHIDLRLPDATARIPARNGRYDLPALARALGRDGNGPPGAEVVLVVDPRVPFSQLAPALETMIHNGFFETPVMAPPAGRR